MKTVQEEKKVELRIVDVIARYEEKRNGKLTGVVIYTVRPSERTLAIEPETLDYRVVFFDGALQNCTCRGYREHAHCYHSAELAKREAAIQAAKAIKARWAEIDAVVGDVSQKGTLNGSSQGFSLLR